MAKAIKRKYGWIRDLPDARDLKYAMPMELEALPSKIDLRPGMPEVYDQSASSSCVGHGVAGAYHYDEIKEKKTHVWQPSRLFIYYNARAMEGTTAYDCGASIRDGIKGLASKGVCDEKYHPFDVKAVTKKPTATAYKKALPGKINKYFSIDNTNINALKSCLAKGYPFVFGFTVYESFESQEVATTGIMPMPQPNESVLGGHCVVGCGYDDEKKWVICRNSWSRGWALDGYFMMPYEFITSGSYADDFWQITYVPTNA